jgi:hypothetical protein
MTSVAIAIKGKTHKEVLDLLNNIQTVIQSNSWDICSEYDVSLVNSGGEASLVIVNNEDKYHGVKVNCCE